MRRLPALVLVALLALTGCSGDEPAGGPAAGPGSGSGGASSAASLGADPSAPSAPALEQPRPASRDLQIASCTSGEGSVEATGEVRNGTGKPVDVVVTVEWLDEQGAVLDTRYAELQDVPARGSSPYAVQAELDATASSCTTRAAAGRLG